ncbi:hypothetical protein [Streptomyces sp. NPDC091371]|uniref:hypothetical protein n=1 Tax=Streptomyces sp. NPDC091371 TaxID=3155303 RepID=UPI00341AF6A5
MAGYRLTVCLPGAARDRLEGSRPYSDDPWIWDHWRIGGSANGRGYRIRPGHETDPRLIHDQPLPDGSREPSLPGRPWGDFCPEWLPGTDYEYLAQTPVAAFARWADGLRLDPSEEYVRTEARRADWPGSLLTPDGGWWEEGDRPLHGACDDPGTCPHTPPTTDEYGGPGYLAGLPDDTLLVGVRCHV